MKSKTTLLFTFIALLTGYAGGIFFPPRNINAENIRYMPHVPPKESMFGQYEDKTEPFIVKNTQFGRTVIVEDHKWEIECKEGTPRYKTTATAYTRVKMNDGKFHDLPIRFEEEHDYNPAQSATVPESRLPVADADKLPDSLYYSSLAVHGIYGSAVWERIRTAALPFTFVANNNEYTVTDRQLPLRSGSSAYTTIATSTMRKANSSQAVSPFRLKEERIITQ